MIYGNYPSRNFSRHFIALLIATTVSLLPLGGALAADDVTVKLAVSKVATEKDGKEKLTPADEAKPGDVLQYDAVYLNTTKGAVKGVAATVPIPEGLELLPDTAKPAGALASTDGKDFAAMPLMTKPEGSEKAKPVPLGQYRALRWALPPLDPGASSTVTLRARVLTNLTIQSPTKPKQ